MRTIIVGEYNLDKYIKINIYYDHYKEMALCWVH